MDAIQKKKEEITAKINEVKDIADAMRLAFEFGGLHDYEIEWGDHEIADLYYDGMSVLTDLAAKHVDAEWAW